MSTRKRRAALAIAALLWAAGAHAGSGEAEIERLLGAIGRSGCDFVRNGEAHPASEAESHLRMKYRKGRRHIDSAEDFIEKAASGSSLTGRAYAVRCPGEAEQSAASWLGARLREYRADGHAPGQAGSP